jgi:hypothetical protein
MRQPRVGKKFGNPLCYALQNLLYLDYRSMMHPARVRAIASKLFLGDSVTLNLS